ncbi:MAG: endonuclease domain-containing protein [Candidatus Marinimicrobia bacterium]|nr:endonuclease domain-containing protein [Candidatus Neomarinimicrobiota bacterium]MCF7827672.1 endonuclease domain-containing protein [Candidatus Neomarinimicrobiota bacterium]MCF7881273.1 endonuclease domain-containing protein [Candidatus Neomarinimicrobiota bacterium]
MRQMNTLDNPFSLASINPDLREHIKKRCRKLRQQQTPVEKKMWEAIRNRQIGGVKFYRQAPLIVTDRGDTGFYIVDFYSHECRLAIELDGKIHRSRREYDRWLSEIIRQYDIRIERWTNKMILEQLPVVVKQLSRIVEEQRR